MENVVLEVQDVMQFISVDNVGKKLKNMIIDQKIEDRGDTVEITFIIDKNKGE